MTASDLVLSLAPPAILLGLVIIFLARKLYREFPLFFVYVLYASIAGILRTTVGNRLLYFRLYWTTEAVYGVLGLLVIYEVLRRVFPIEHEHASQRRLRWLLPVGVLLMLGLFTLLETRYHPLGHGQIPRLVRGIYWFDVGVHALEGIVLILVVALTQVFSLSWRKYEFGILTGFGISSFVTMFADLFRFELGGGYETFFRYGPPIAYLVAALVWLEAFFRPPEPDRRDPQTGPDEMLDEVGRAKDFLAWIERLLGLRHPICVIPV